MYKLISIMLILSTPVISQNAPIDFDLEDLEKTGLGQYLKMTRIPRSKLLLILILAESIPQVLSPNLPPCKQGCPLQVLKACTDRVLEPLILPMKTP